jgi:hypothetical protein
MPATKVVVASISVTIEGGTKESVLSAESNDCINEGKTSFTKGDTYKFLVFKSADVTIATQFSTYGSVSGPVGQLAVPQTETITFQDSEKDKKQDKGKATLGKPADAVESMGWLGNHTADGLSLLADKVTLTVTKIGIGIAKIKYSSSAYIHQLTIPADLPDDVKEINIFIIGEAPDPNAVECPVGIS